MIDAFRKLTWREAAFSLKSFAAAMLALYVAFRLDLSQPMWSVTTVYVVSQPLAGMVLSKSLYRVLGTAIGAVASLVFVALFSSSPELFCLALALWMGLGTAITIYLRDAPEGYVGMLAGYSAAIIGLSAALEPETAFDFAVARCLEIMLGILCATFIHHVIFPQRAGEALRAAFAATLPSMARWAGDALHSEASEAKGLIDRRRILSAIVGLDRLRLFASFDTPALRVFDPAIRQFEGKLLSLLAVLMSVYDRFAILTRERPADATQLQPLLERAAAHMSQSAEFRTPAEAASESVDETALRAEIALRLPSIDDLRRDPAAFLIRSILLRLIDVIDLWRESVWLRAHIASGAPLPRRQTAPAFRPYRDFTAALIGGAVTATAVIAGAAFWIFTAWPSGPTAVTFAAIICAIMGGRDNPGEASAVFLRMGLVGSVIAGIYLFVILPQLTDFVPLVLALAPFYLICGALLAIPSAVSFVMPVIFLGGGLLSIKNSMTYDFESFLNSALGYIVGIAMGGATLRLLRPAGGGRTARRLARGLFRELTDICQATSTDRMAFESRMFDRINALFTRLDPMVHEERRLIQGSLASLRIGLNILALRRLLPELPPSAAWPVADALTALRGLFTQGAKGRKTALPRDILDLAYQRILSLDESPSTVRAAEALFSIAMTVRQHGEFFGEPSNESASVWLAVAAT